MCKLHSTYQFFDVPFSNCSEGPELSSGLNWGLAGKGVIVKEKVFQNLTAFELRQKGATNVGRNFVIIIIVS